MGILSPPVLHQDVCGNTIPFRVSDSTFSPSSTLLVASREAFWSGVLLDHPAAGACCVLR